MATPNINVRPKHQHDCTECRFLGSYYYKGETYDLYYCSQNGNPTVVARYGKDGDYLSGMWSAKSDLTDGHSNSPLAMALKTAEKMGLVEIKFVDKSETF